MPKKNQTNFLDSPILPKTQEALGVIGHFCRESKPYVAFSGGKDSVVTLQLVRLSGIEYDAHFSFTTVDPPEVLNFIREYYPEVIWERPEKTMWQLIIENGIPPTRKMRYCCRLIKEVCGDGRTVVTGIRSRESSARQKRNIREKCLKDGMDKLYIHPILDWTLAEVWSFIRRHHLPHCSLYDEGFERIGCILCPNNRLRVRDVERWPKFYKAYLRTFEKMLEVRSAKGLKTTWRNGQDVMDWWLQDDKKYSERLVVERSQLHLDLEGARQ